MLPTFITPIEIDLTISFVVTLTASCWFCLSNYSIEKSHRANKPKVTQDPGRNAPLSVVRDEKSTATATAFDL
ncbi:MAG: hypothetical protein PHE55_06810 [Methylococcaceae bacterium]|nr:hypothetical protein [Methylococcaceae bacterium]